MSKIAEIVMGETTAFKLAKAMASKRVVAPGVTATPIQPVRATRMPISSAATPRSVPLGDPLDWSVMTTLPVLFEYEDTSPLQALRSLLR